MANNRMAYKFPVDANILAAAAATSVDSFLHRTPSICQDGLEVYLPMAGLVDKDKERARLEKQAGKLTKDMEVLEKRLSGSNFVEKARRLSLYALVKFRFGESKQSCRVSIRRARCESLEGIEPHDKARDPPVQSEIRERKREISTRMSHSYVRSRVAKKRRAGLRPFGDVHTFVPAQAPAKVVEKVKADLQAQKEQLKTVQQAIADLDQ